MNDEIRDWESAYRQLPYQEIHPHPLVLQLAERVDPTRHLHWLDLGCGDGRHLVYLAQRGWQMYGLDLAMWGLIRTGERLEMDDLPAMLTYGNMQKLPLAQGSLDGVISIKVIHHQVYKDIRKTFSEIQRVLRPGGLLLASLPQAPVENWKQGRYREVEAGTYIPLEGFEQGIPHHFFEQTEISECLTGFEVLNQEIDEWGYVCILAQNIQDAQ